MRAGIAGLTVRAKAGIDGGGGRPRQLHGVAEVLRLYEQLERALDNVDDERLARLVRQGRDNGGGLGPCGRELDRLLGVVRRFRSGSLVPVEVEKRRGVWRPRWLRRVLPSPLVWEAVAFALGVAVSFLLT